MTPPDSDTLLNVTEAARFLRLSPGTLYHFVSQKRVPTIRLSARCIRFSLRALYEWLEGLSQPVTGDDRSDSDNHKRRNTHESPKTK